MLPLHPTRAGPCWGESSRQLPVPNPAPMAGARAAGAGLGSFIFLGGGLHKNRGREGPAATFRGCVTPVLPWARVRAAGFAGLCPALGFWFRPSSCPSPG